MRETSPANASHGLGSGMVHHDQTVPVRAAPRGRPAPAESKVNLSGSRVFARPSACLLRDRHTSEHK